MADYTITLNDEQIGYLHTLLEEITDYWSRGVAMTLSYDTHIKKLQNIVEQIRPVEKKYDMVDVRKEYYDHKVDKLEKKVEVMDKALDDLINWQNTLADLFETHQKGKKKEKKA